MIEINVTLNGKPFSEQTFQNEIDKAILEGVIGQIKETIRAALTAEEFSQITLNFKGTIDDFGVEINGPDEITEKAEAALQEE